MYAIVDIETTGGFAGRNKITEVAIYIYDGEKVVDSYTTLVNPEQQIPDYITGLTGIDQQMVDTAPTFKEVAEKIHFLLENKVFVAHNVHFDYSFIKRELETHGFRISPKKVCTVRLSREILPGFKSYGLGKLCEQLGIQIKNRHRAGGDAEATTVLFGMLLKKNPAFVEFSIKRTSGETKLPPNLPKEEFEDLPEQAGVYYFIDAHGEIIYVGKAKNIKKRITSHFSGTSKNRRNQYIRNEIHHIDYELTGTELVALLLESSEIKRLWPKYNRAQKFKPNQWAIYSYEDREGYLRFNISKLTKGIQPQATFYSHVDAWQFLIEKVKDFDLCPKLCGIQKSNGACFDYQYDNCKGACDNKETVFDYNGRLKEAMEAFSPAERSYAILGAGRHEEEQSVILVEKGTYHGFGFYESQFSFSGIEEIKNVITHYKSTAEIEQYIQTYINSPTGKIVELD